MSGLFDPYGNPFNREAAPNAGKTPQTGAERLARFREELDVEIAGYEGGRWKHPSDTNIISALQKAKDTADEESIYGNAENAVKENFKPEFGLIPTGERDALKSIENAVNRATKGTYFVKTPRPDEEVAFVSDVEMFKQREEPREPGPREEFYQRFRLGIDNYRGRIGHTEASISGQIQARALGYATNFPDGDPTADRIGTRLLAWHNGKVKGEESNKIDGAAVRALFQKAKAELEALEDRTDHSTKEHVEKATPLILEYIASKTSGGTLVGKERVLHHIRQHYAQDAQEITVLDFLNASPMIHGLNQTELKELQDIVKAASAYANEKIDTPAIDLTAEHTASAEETAPATDDNVPKGVDPAMAAASQAMADPAKATALMDAMRGGPLEEEEKDLLFPQILQNKIKELDYALSEPQIELVKALIEDGCLNGSDILDIANNAYRSGKIDREAARQVVAIAIEAWNIEARLLEKKHGLASKPFDERPGGRD